MEVMISQTMLALGTKRSVIREIFEYGCKRKAEIGAENVFDFSLGNPSVPSPSIVNDTLLELIIETFALVSLSIDAFISSSVKVGMPQVEKINSVALNFSGSDSTSSLVYTVSSVA